MDLSRNLGFETLPNIRDLGGIATRDGKHIVSGRLFRSGALYRPSAKDVERLSGLGLRKIYDFRSPTEREEKPDVVLPGVRYIHAPILREDTMGISREQKSDRKALKEKREQLFRPGGVKEMLLDNYLLFVDEMARKGYSTFLHDLLSSAEDVGGAYLWHCTAGKDRAGFATVLVLEILGVDRATIFEDYLSTNRYMAGEKKMILDMVPWTIRVLLPRKLKKRLHEVAEELTQVDRDYLQATYGEMERLYGGVEGFLREGLGITDEEKARFRDFFLE